MCCEPGKGRGRALPALCAILGFIGYHSQDVVQDQGRPLDPSCFQLDKNHLKSVYGPIFAGGPISYDPEDCQDTHLEPEPGQGIKDILIGAKQTGGVEV